MKYLICLITCFIVEVEINAQTQIINHLAGWMHDKGWIDITPSHEPVYFIKGDYNENNKYILVFEDNFDGNNIDNDVWRTSYPWGRMLINNLDQQYYSDNNVNVSGGQLKLTAKRENKYELVVPYEPPSTILGDGVANLRSFTHTSGIVYSKKKFGFGKYEIRCKLPKGKGFFPAFWVFADEKMEDDVTLYPNWRYEEIDVFEFWNEKKKVGGFTTYDPTLNQKVPHFGSIYDYGTIDPDKRDAGGGNWKSNTDFSDRFHTFTMTYDEYHIKWYVDGVLRYHKPRFIDLYTELPLDHQDLYTGRVGVMESRSFPRYQRFHIIANLAIQKGAGVGPLAEEPDHLTVLPQDMVVDYIRFSRKEPPCIGPVLNVYENSVLAIDPDKYNIKVADLIVLHNNVNLFWGQQIELIAKDEILFYPGVFIDGGNFEASINPTYCSSYQRPNFSGPRGSSSNVVPIPIIDTIKKVENTDLYSDLNFLSYPNPTNSILNIEIGEIGESDLNISLFDLQGRELYTSKNINDKRIKIDMSSFVSGSYILQIYDALGKRVYSNKIIKE